MDDGRQGHRPCRDAWVNRAGLSRVPALAQPQSQGQNAGPPVPIIHQRPDSCLRKGRHQSQNNLRGVGRTHWANQVPYSCLLHGHQARKGRQVPNSD